MTIPTAVDIISRRAPLAAMYDHPVAVTIRECHRLGLNPMSTPFIILGRRAIVIDLPPRTPRVDFRPTEHTDEWKRAQHERVWADWDVIRTLPDTHPDRIAWRAEYDAYAEALMAAPLSRRWTFLDTPRPATNPTKGDANP